MATHDDVRRIASRLPGAVEGEGRFGFSVTHKGKAKGFLWAWLEKVHPKKPRVINDEVIAVVVSNLTIKDMIIDSDPEKYFTEPHYNGYCAVLVRLAKVELDELEGLIIEAWRCKAPTELLRQFEAKPTLS